MDNKDQQRLLSQAANAKLVRLNEEVMHPLLARKIEEQLADLCESYKTNNEVKTSCVAYIAACRDIMRELEAVARKGDQASVKLNLNPEQ